MGPSAVSAAAPARATFGDLNDDMVSLVATSLDLDLLEPGLVQLASTCKAMRSVLAGLVAEARWKQSQAKALCERCGGRYAWEMLRGGHATEIHWARAQLAAEECVILAPLIRSNQLLQLKKLRLHNNDIGAAGSRALATAFLRGAVPELQVLGLGSNRIGDEVRELFTNRAFLRIRFSVSFPQIALAFFLPILPIRISPYPLLLHISLSLSLTHTHSHLNAFFFRAARASPSPYVKDVCRSSVSSVSRSTRLESKVRLRSLRLCPPYASSTVSTYSVTRWAMEACARSPHISLTAPRQSSQSSGGWPSTAASALAPCTTTPRPRG